MFGIVCAHKAANTPTFQMTRDRGATCPGFCCGCSETFVEKRRQSVMRQSVMEVQCSQNGSRMVRQPNQANWHRMHVGKRYEAQSRLRTLANSLDNAIAGWINWARALLG